MGAFHTNLANTSPVKAQNVTEDVLNALPMMQNQLTDQNFDKPADE